MLWLNRRSKGLESAESLIPEAVIGMSRYIRPLDLDHIVALVHRWLIHDIFMLRVRLMAECRSDITNRPGSALAWR